MTTTEGPGRVAYLFPAIALVSASLYYGYGIADRVALSTERSEARVTGKQFAPGSTTYNTNIVAGRAWIQSYKNEDLYIVLFNIGNEATGGAVSKPIYDSLQPGDIVRVKYQRTRFSKRLLVIDVAR